MAGNISTAVTSIGTAFTATPLAAIAAPVMFFTALSAGFKADENKEKARVMLAEAEDKAEEMNTSEFLCRAIGERADMFRDLLGGLERMFAPCVGKVEELVCRKAGCKPPHAIRAALHSQKSGAFSEVWYSA